jgi:hypothetical protein
MADQDHIAVANPGPTSSLNLLTGLDLDGIGFQLTVDPQTLSNDIHTYDPNSGTSPLVAVCRKYVRLMFDAYLAVDPTMSQLPPPEEP